MNSDVAAVFEIVHWTIFTLAAATVATAWWQVRRHKVGWIRVLPLAVYAVHLMLFYLAQIVAHHTLAAPENYSVVAMAWSMAVRLHAALMVLFFVNGWLQCPKN